MSNKLNNNFEEATENEETEDKELHNKEATEKEQDEKETGKLRSLIYFFNILTLMSNKLQTF